MCCVGDNAVDRVFVCFWCLLVYAFSPSVCVISALVSPLCNMWTVRVEHMFHYPGSYTLQHGASPNSSHGIAQARKISTREAMNEAFK